MFDTLNDSGKETAKKIISLLNGLSYAQAIDIVDCAHDLLKFNARVNAAPPTADIALAQQTMRDSLKRIISQYPAASTQPAIPDDNAIDTSPQTSRQD